MEEEVQQHSHCVNCVSRRCMTRPEPGVSCDLIGCPLVCGAVFHSCKADEHRLLCPFERVPCLNSNFGCPFTLARNKVAEHLEMCPASVVCCTMEWNRWPVSYSDRKSYESLSRDADEVSQLDMALALQDQRMLLESLKVATMMSKATGKISKPREQISVNSSVQEVPRANGLVSADEESYGALYEATVETTRSLAAALDILNSATRDIGMLNTSLQGTTNEMDEESNRESSQDRNAKDQDHLDEGEIGAVGGIDYTGTSQNAQAEQNGSSDLLCNLNTSSYDTSALCNGFPLEKMCTQVKDQDQNFHGDSTESNITNGDCVEADGTSEPPSSLLVAEQLKEGSALPDSTYQHILMPDEDDDEDLCWKKDLGDSKDVNGSPLSHATSFKFLSNSWYIPKEDKAVDTSDLEVAEDPMGLQGIDLITAALLFCLGDSPGGRGISDSRMVDVYHVDFGTQTFSLPSAILATNTMVGEIASASACDHANPQLSNPSPFQTLGLDLVLECVARYQPKQRSMFTFVCGQLFRRKEFSSHFKNVHGDIHAGLNGWMEQRCPLAYYGCTYSQRRFCPSTQGAKIIHDRHLRSFGVQPCVSTALEEPSRNCVLGLRSDHLSSLPFEVLQHIAGFLDGFSLCQLACVSRLMRDICGSLLQSRGMVILQWGKKKYPEGNSSWQIKEKIFLLGVAIQYCILFC
uniref:F-box protein 30 n=1 Tax=Rattus norvegicus TaxID=10116 RepID=A0ABK0LMC2_RAT